MAVASKKFTERQFLFFVVNYIAGFGFISTALSLFELGPLSWVIFFLVSLISLIVTLAFARVSAIDKNNYGGAYLWAKKAFNSERYSHRLFIFFTGWNNFIASPLYAAIAPLFILSAFKGIDGIQGNAANTWILIAAGFTFYLLLAFLSTKGTSLNKKLIAVFASIKWAVLLSTLIVALIVIGKNGNGYAINNDIKQGPFKEREITLGAVATVFITFFYFYSGAEDISTMTPDVKTTNFRKILIISFIAVFLFYFVGILIFNGLLNVSQSDDDKGKDGRIASVADIFRLAGGLGALIFYGVGALFNNVSTRLSTIIANSRKILPLAQDNYLPTTFSKANSKGEFQNAIWFTFGTTIITMTVLFFVPLITSNFDFDKSTEYAASIGSAATLVQYILVFFIIFRLIYKKEQLYQKNWTRELEQILFGIGVFIILLMLLFYLFPVIDGKTKWQLKNTLTLVVYGVLILIGFALFMTQEYKRNKQKESYVTPRAVT